MTLQLTHAATVKAHFIAQYGLELVLFSIHMSICLIVEISLCTDGRTMVLLTFAWPGHGMGRATTIFDEPLSYFSMPMY